MRRLPALVGFVALAAGLFAPSTARAQQSLNFHLGGFVPRGEDARDINDVLVNNLCCLDDPLAFRIKDFAGGSVGLEYVVGVGDFLDAGLGVGYYKRNVPSVYLDLVNDNGTEIEQNLRLRVAPFAATIRFLPLGHSHGVEPYIGAGIGVFNWRYSESGDWVDPSDDSIFRQSFVGSGTATGPIVLGGVRIPAGPMAFGGEVKWQDAKGDLPADQGFSGSKIDLGGLTYSVVLSVRF